MPRLPLIAVAGAMLLGDMAHARESIAFVSCPIVQDTPTVPCWLATHEGKEYYLGVQSDVSAPFNPPSLGHLVLVEGTVTDQMECGVPVIDPVTVSVLPELSPECDEMRTPMPGIDISFEPRRPPGPSNGRLAFAGFLTPPEPPKPPFDPKLFVIEYSFEGMVNFQTPRIMGPALEYAQLSDARRIEVTGHRGATRLSDGTLMAEHDGIARERAEEIVRMFRGAGLSETEFVVSANEAAVEGGPGNRKVELRIIP